MPTCARDSELPFRRLEFILSRRNTQNPSRRLRWQFNAGSYERANDRQVSRRSRVHLVASALRAPLSWARRTQPAAVPPPPPPSPRGTLCIRDAQLPRRDVGVERGFHPDERARVFTDASEIARFAHSKFVNVPRVRSIASMFAFNSPATGTYWGCERPGCTCSREEAQTSRLDYLPRRLIPIKLRRFAGINLFVKAAHLLQLPR